MGKTANFLCGVEQGEFVIAVFDADELSHQAATGEDAEVFPADIAGGGDLADDRSGWVLHLGDGSRPLAWARAEAAQRGSIAECFVRSEEVVDLGPPAVGIFVEMLDGVAADIGPQLAFEGSVDPFDFALGLRMVRPAMERMNSQADQLSVEPTDGPWNLKGRGKGVVAEDALRQAELTEGIPEDSERGGHGQVQAGTQGQQIAGMVVKDGEGMDFPPSDLQRPFVVTLPKLVGQGAFEAQQLGWRRGGRCDASAAFIDPQETNVEWPSVERQFGVVVEALEAVRITLRADKVAAEDGVELEDVVGHEVGKLTVLQVVP